MQDLKREIAKKEVWDLTKNIKSLEINVKEYQESSASGIVEVLLPILRKKFKKNWLIQMCEGRSWTGTLWCYGTS